MRFQAVAMALAQGHPVAIFRVLRRPPCTSRADPVICAYRVSAVSVGGTWATSGLISTPPGRAWCSAIAVRSSYIQHLLGRISARNP
jgi:hypothetical protein